MKKRRKDIKDIINIILQSYHPKAVVRPPLKICGPVGPDEQHATVTPLLKRW